MGQKITFGIGGYDETKPNNNVVEIEDIEDEQIVKHLEAKDLLLKKLGITQEEALLLLS